MRRSFLIDSVEWRGSHVTKIKQLTCREDWIADSGCNTIVHHLLLFGSGNFFLHQAGSGLARSQYPVP
ncbi:hypothetical protein GBA52_013779 [Prunus armeniaca]|nr:hypothetical protein GBA52_013779 [Prunus armeniaca]